MKYYCLIFFYILQVFFHQNIQAQEQPVNLQLKWWHQFQFAGYYAAQLKGFYKDAGLKVNFISGDENHPPVEQILNGKADFSITGSDLIVNFAKGEPVKVVGAVFQHSPYVFISLKSNNIKSPSDLVGKKIMGSKYQGWVQLKAMLIKEGISDSSIQLVEHSWENNDLIEGKVDVITGYSSVEPFQLIQKGVEVSYIEPINYGIDFYGDVLFCHQKLAKENPQLVNKFKNASLKGWEYAMEHIDEMANYILTLPGVKERGVTKEVLLFEANAMKKLILPDLVEIGHMNEGRWQHILDVHKAFGLVPTNATITNFIYDESKVAVDSIFKWIYYALAIIAITFLMISFYGVSLRKAVKKRTVDLEKEIANRKLTEERLLMSEQRLELATTAAGIGIWNWDLTTNNIYFSDIIKTMLGYQPHEIENSAQSFMHLLHPSHNKEVNDKLLDHIYNKIETYEVIVRLKTKDNNWKWILIISKALWRDEKGKALKLTGIHLDIDNLKRKELEQQDLTNELMHSNKELQQFAYITSHNLRAPVANLMSLLMLFNTHELSEENQLYFEKINFSVDKLNQTLSDLNEILTSRTSKAIQFETLNFKEEIDNSLATISEEVKAANAIINLDLNVNEIYYSRKIMNSILQNLLTNALKYKSQNKQCIIDISTWVENNFIVLSVKDNGIGINLERYQNKLFGLYQRFTDSAPGKGLGLFIIKNQIEALQGEIKVESKLNEGTNFIIKFSTNNSSI